MNGCRLYIPTCLADMIARSFYILVLGFALSALSGRLVAQEEQEEPPVASPQAARVLSFLGTAAPVALAATTAHPEAGLLLWGGLVFGPTVGYVYAGKTRSGMSRAGIRGLVLIGAVTGSFLMCGVFDCTWDADNGETGVRAADAPVQLLYFGGLGIISYLDVRDIIQVGRLVRESSRREGASLQLQPAYSFRDRRATLRVLITW